MKKNIIVKYFNIAFSLFFVLIFASCGEGADDDANYEEPKATIIGYNCVTHSERQQQIKSGGEVWCEPLAGGTWFFERRFESFTDKSYVRKATCQPFRDGIRTVCTPIYKQ